MNHDDYDWYILEINPEPWAVGPIAYARRSGKMSAYMGQNAQLNAYKEAIREELLTKNPLLLEGKISLQLFFWRRRDDYETAQAKRHRKHDADLTNLQKATEDALQGLLFKNDKDVIDCHTRVVEQGPDAAGRVVVGVSNKLRELDYPFDKLPLPSRRPQTNKRIELEGQFEFEEIF